MSRTERTITTPGEALAVTGICFGAAIFSSLNAVAAGFPTSRSGGEGVFTDGSLAWLVVTEIALALAAVSLLRVRRYAVGSLFPVPTLKGCAIGIGLFFAAWLVGWLVVSPFSTGQPDQPIAQMLQDARPSLPVIIATAMVNGTYEEVFLLGFLLRGLRGFGLSTALGIMLLVRVLYHLYQGPLGALWILAIGLVFGLYYVRTSLLWPPVFAHILWDIVPFVFGQS